jgi:hypothetical protein
MYGMPTFHAISEKEESDVLAVARMPRTAALNLFAWDPETCYFSDMRILALVLAATSLSLAQEQKRDLSKYDAIGPYKIVKFASGPKTDQSEAEIREFLWTHWRQHRRGTLTVTHQYVEGIIRAEYFVEPDRKGRWGIVQNTDYPYRPNIAPKRFSCSSFERVEPDLFHLPLVPIRDSEERRPETYLLHPVCGPAKDPHLW